MNNKDKYWAQFNGCLANYEDCPEVRHLEQMYQMIKDGKIKCSAVDRGTLGFLSWNKRNRNCARCKASMPKGIPVFFIDQDGWCEDCATSEEKQCKFYQAHLKRKSVTNDRSEATNDCGTEPADCR